MKQGKKINMSVRDQDPMVSTAVCNRGRIYQGSIYLFILLLFAGAILTILSYKKDTVAQPVIRPQIGSPIISSPGDTSDVSDTLDPAGDSAQTNDSSDTDSNSSDPDGQITSDIEKKPEQSAKPDNTSEVSDSSSKSDQEVSKVTKPSGSGNAPADTCDQTRPSNLDSSTRTDLTLETDSESASDTTTMPNSSETACSYCNKTGHTVSACPTKVRNEKSCTYCSQVGHTIDSCSVKLADEAPCTYCGKTGHKIANCQKKTEDEAPCTYCNQIGHTIDSCSVKLADEAPCTYCGQTGHKISSCEQKAEDETPCSYCGIVGHKQSNCPKKAEDEQAPCNYCGITGHKEANCPYKPQPCSFCREIDHTVKHCAAKAVSNGAVGRWVIPDVKVNVAVYAVKNGMSQSDAQDITDAKDSASTVKYGMQDLIADHNYQGFHAIKKCVVGTRAYMDTGSEEKEYVCTGIIYDGHNTGTKLADADYESILSKNKGGYTCYTCNDFTGESITIVFFQPV